jgi:hypothetical protein
VGTVFWAIKEALQPLKKDRKMAEVKLNPVLEQVHGKIGDLVFRKYQDRTILARKPEVHQPETEAQIKAREKFSLAALYGKSVMADPEKKALYDAKAKDKGQPVFSLMVADFFNAPVVDEIDLSGYTGQIGGTIGIRAHDDFQLKGVEVVIRDTAGTVLEQGAAANGTLDGKWTYTATATVPAGQTVAIEVTATDLPGHKGTLTQSR